MSSLLQQVLVRADHHDVVFFNQGELCSAGREWDALKGTGLLISSRSKREGWCPECGDNLAPLGFAVVSDRDVTYLRCPDCGLVPFDPDELKQWRLHLPRLAEFLRDALQLAGGMHEVLTGQVWQLGRRTWNATSRMCFLARHLHRREGIDALAELGLQRNALLFVPAMLPGEGLRPSIATPIIRLVDVLSVIDDELVVEAEGIASQLPTDAEAHTGRSRPRKRSTRTAAIEAVKQQLVEHLRAARNHAEAVLDLKGIPALLPRPTQKDLAKLTGLSEAAVSRCFRDPEARELRLLWTTASDIEAVQRLPLGTTSKRRA